MSSQVVTHIIAQKVYRERTRRDTKRNKTFSRKRTCFYFSPLFYDTTELKERAERERERERETIFGSEGGVQKTIIIAQTHRTRREVRLSSQLLLSSSSPKFSFLSLSVSLERTFPRTQRYKKKLSLPLSFSSGSDGFFKSYFDLSFDDNDYCHHRHLRGLAGSRARVFCARKTRIPRAQSLFFVSLSRDIFGSFTFILHVFFCVIINTFNHS